MKKTVENLMEEVAENLQKVENLIEDFDDWYEAEYYIDEAQELIDLAYIIWEKRPNVDKSIIDMWQGLLNRMSHSFD